MTAVALAVDAAHWWGPLGWLYRNCVGNLAASALWGPIGLGIGYTMGKAKEKRAERRHAELVDLHHAHHAELLAAVGSSDPGPSTP